MKLLNKEGRFQFIKNQQVEIDENLKKYTEIENILTHRERPDSNEPQVSLSASVGADATTRNLLGKVTFISVSKYLNSENASEFNNEFKDILINERLESPSSISVINSLWLPENAQSEQQDNKIRNSKKKAGMLRSLYNDISEAFRRAANTTRNENKEAAEQELSVLEFFDTIHIMVGNEKKFTDRISGYFKLLENAKTMGQTAHIDKICQNIVIDIYESVLFANGYNRFVTFGQTEHISKKGGKAVDICYIKNFDRPIPNDVVEKKKLCDEMCVFDNYCVMYYDPEGKMYGTESKAKRDPILFGLINHSDKLYYIADWVDEKCDLSLEKIAELCHVGELK